MNRKVLVAGAGQLGSRYLQGLSKLNEPLDIFVFDPSSESLARSKQRWCEMQAETAHEVHYMSSLTALPASIDLAIVATTADVRTALTAEINRLVDIRNWVLEKVLTQSAREVVDLQRTLAGKSAWVNTPMYQWPLYAKLRELYPSGAPIEACFEGFRGLACNTIHYIDFVSRWNGAPVTQIDATDLQPEWYVAKRDGFYEIDGKLEVDFADDSKLKLGSDRSNLGYKINIKIAGDDWKLSEADGIAQAADGRFFHGEVAVQSQLTAPMVETIFAGEHCGLPTLAESSQQHTILLNALLEHWNRHMPNKVERLPIT